MRTSIRVLSESEIAEIEDASMRILSEIGLWVMCERARDLLREVGATVSDSGNVRIDRDIIEHAVDTAPKKIMLAARDSKHDCRLYDREYPALSTDGSAIHMIDFDSSEKSRMCTTRDLYRLAIISDYLPEIDIFWPMVIAGDVPDTEHTMKEFVTSLMGTAKHVQHEATGRLEATTEIEIGREIAGGEEELRARPIFSAVQCPGSPLMIERGSAEAIIEFSRSGIPIVGMSIAQSGATAPITIAGTLSVSNAETLGALVLSQAASEGTPFIYGSSSGPVDLPSGSFLAGSPELSLISAGSVQIAAHYGIPSLAAGMITDAKTPSQQAAFEKLQTGLLPALAGGTIITGIGGLLTCDAVSVEQLIIDCDIWGSLRRIIRGIKVNSDSISLDLIKAMGSNPNYASEMSTLREFKSELWQPRIPTRQSYASWKASGSKMIEEMAGEIAREALTNHRVAPMEPDQERAIMRAYNEFLKSLNHDNR